MKVSEVHGRPRIERALGHIVSLRRAGYALDTALAVAIGAFALGSGDVRHLRALLGLSLG